ncbi:MAG: Ni/Fe hydrogenase subunit alpha [Chloroflexota bacterium]|mgnify:CR=1 FL=1|nr:MAG: Ni/Fe hydrogenase subunit alpha [Chloroflexota bacterium]
MAQQITIDPVTRLEGHGKITIQLNDAGEVQDAQFHVTQLRGFEKFCEGRPFHEMPSLMARICGICPVSHLIASAKACDALLAVRVPPAAVALRELLNLAQLAQSHALSFFYLSAPDLLLGMDADPAKRNIFGVYQTNPQMARDGIRLRQAGQQIIEILGGKRIHPGWVVPGGVSEPLTELKREQILAMLPEVVQITRNTLDWYKETFQRFEEEIRTFANFPTLFMSIVGENGRMNVYDGKLRFIDAEGKIVADNIDGNDYADYIAEAVQPSSYLKSPYYKPLGFPAGIYRVGPLARLNIVESLGTPLADAEMPAFRQLDRQSSFHFHYARLIEVLYAWERIEQLLNDPKILDEHVRARAAVNADEGVGVAEAPRGTLIHHYQIDKDGLITRANLIIATGHNNLAMNRGVLQVAQHFVKGARLDDGMLNRVEAVVRAYDPCLSCSTHAVGQMPLHVQLLAPDGSVVDELVR